MDNLDSLARDFLLYLTERLGIVLFLAQYDYAKTKEGAEMTLNEALRNARKSSGMTLKDVSSETGISISAVHRYENGSRKIPVSYIRYWALKGTKINWEEIDFENK